MTLCRCSGPSDDDDDTGDDNDACVGVKYDDVGVYDSDYEDDDRVAGVDDANDDDDDAGVW